MKYLLELDDWQKEFLETEGDKILCTGRQVGKSEVCSLDAAKWALSNKGKVVLMIAPTERQAYALFEKTLDYLLTNHKKSVKMGKYRPTKTQLILTNETKILCLPTGTSGTGIRGLTIHRLYVDEASRVPEDVWSAVTPMLLTTGGATILLSTPFGATGEFYRCWVNEDNAYSSFKRFSCTSEIVMRERPISKFWTEQIRDKALLKLEQAKARMSNREYAQEYLGEFIEDLFRYFPDTLIEKCCILKRQETIPKKYPLILGVDIARMGEDEGTYEILEKRQTEIHQIENIITRKQLTTQTEDRIIDLNKKYNFHKIYIDAGSGTLGVSIFDHLIKNEEVKRKLVAINNAARVIDRKTGREQRLIKEDLYDNLRSLMEKGEIKLLDDDSIVESLRSVQYEYVQVNNQATRLRIFGDYTHIVEGLIRAAWGCSIAKNINTFFRSIKL